MTTDAPEVPGVARDLYASPPEDFVASRNALAKQLKADGDAATAAVVAKLRRPAVAAFVVNVAARARADLVSELLDAGGRLAGAQRQLLSGKNAASKDLRAASDERRRIVRELTDVAISAAADAGRSAEHLRDEVAGTFEAATLDDELAERLRSGTIEKPVTPSAGLEGFEGFAVIPGGAAAGEDGVGDEEASHEDAPSRMRRAADAATAEATRAREVADRAVAAADEAAERANELSKAAEDADRAAREAKAEERRLRDEASTARRRADRAQRAADAAARRANPPPPQRRR
ncbi:MAG TPA: hypothetical protein VLA82_04935 [Actinomycetota bacterium]|nr:hypothetical protein [Actinomycetota bacterium]